MLGAVPMSIPARGDGADMRKRHHLPKTSAGNDQTVRRVYRDFVQSAPDGMTPGMVQCLITLKLLATKGIVPDRLLNQECVQSVTGYELVVRNIVHALATPPSLRVWYALSSLPGTVSCDLLAIPYANINLTGLMETGTIDRSDS